MIRGGAPAGTLRRVGRLPLCQIHLRCALIRATVQRRLLRALEAALVPRDIGRQVLKAEVVNTSVGDPHGPVQRARRQPRVRRRRFGGRP
jgi:hypothetical protein